MLIQPQGNFELVSSKLIFINFLCSKQFLSGDHVKISTKSQQKNRNSKHRFGETFLFSLDLVWGLFGFYWLGFFLRIKLFFTVLISPSLEVPKARLELGTAWDSERCWG